MQKTDFLLFKNNIHNDPLFNCFDSKTKSEIDANLEKLNPDGLAVFSVDCPAEPDMDENGRTRTDLPAEPELVEALEAAHEVINYMGDFINGHDMCDQEMEDFVNPLINKVTNAIKKVRGE